MGKRKIEIEKIQNKERRDVTFSKRRKGLFKKAAQLCLNICSNAQIAIIVFSPTGKLYSFGSTSVDQVIHRLFVNEEEEDREEEENKNTHLFRQMKKNDTSGGGGFWWDNVNIKELDSIEKLQVVYNAMLNLKQNVSKRLEELNSAASSSSSHTEPEPTPAADANPLFSSDEYDFGWPSLDDNELENLAELLNDDDCDGDMLQLPQLLNDDNNMLFPVGLQFGE